MERRRTLESEGESMKEWKLLKTLTSSDVSSNNDVHITTDNDGNQFSVDEIYARIKTCERNVATYNDISINKKTIGEIRGNYPAEFFIKNISGFWRCFYIPYSNTYGQGTLTSWGAFHPSYIKTKEEIPAITEIGIGWVKNIEAEIYGR